MQFKKYSRFLEVLIDTIPNPVFYKDRAGRYVGCNQAFSNYLGLSRAELLGKTVYEIAPKELADVYYRADEELFQSRGVQIYEGKVQAGQLGLRSVIFNKQVFFDDEGNLAGLIGVMVDITSLRALESSVRNTHFHDLTRQLEHDIRSPLSVLQVLSTEAADTSHQKLLKQCADRIEGIVTSVRRELSGPPQAVLRTVDLFEIVKRIVFEKQKQFSKIRKAIRLSNAMVYSAICHVDESQLERSISNLINNSMEAIEEKKSGQVEVFLKPEGAWHVLAIKDNGGGIAPDLLPNLGQKGLTHGKKGGSGLGIFHADKVVRESGGSLKITSTWGQGTLVEVRLPMVEPT